MADFYGCLESTSFRVKDRDAFLADPDVQWIQAHAQGEGFFDGEKDDYWAFGWYGQYPSVVLTRWPEGRDDEEELDITEVIERHILPGDVCKIAISGSEKLRYIGGPVYFVTNKGTAHFNAMVDWHERLNEEDVLTIQEQFAADAERVAGNGKK